MTTVNLDAKTELVIEEPKKVESSKMQAQKDTGHIMTQHVPIFRSAQVLTTESTDDAEL